jgi:hypothetical protein
MTPPQDLLQHEYQDLSILQSADLYAVGRTPWMGDQPVTSPYLHTDIHPLSGILNHDPQRSGDRRQFKP